MIRQVTFGFLISMMSSCTKWCNDIIQVSWKTFKLLYCKFIQDNVHHILSESTRFVEDMTKTFWCVFSVHGVGTKCSILQLWPLKCTKMRFHVRSCLYSSRRSPNSLVRWGEDDLISYIISKCHELWSTNGLKSDLYHP